MKARVKATGEIVKIFDKGNGLFEASDGETYFPQGLRFIDDEPDYWEKLHHQAAIAAMQGILSNDELLNDIFKGVYPTERPKYLANRIDDYATALVEKLKNEK